MKKSNENSKIESRVFVFWKLVFFLIVFYLFLISGCHTMNAENRNSQGVGYLEQQKYDLAISEFEAARMQAPDAPNAYYNIASTYHQLGAKNNDPKMYSMAEQYYKLCLEKDPNHVNCHRGMAVLLVETSRTENAFALLRSWEIRQANDANPKIEIARLYQELGKNDDAAKYLTAAVSANPNDIRAYNALAALQESTGDYQNAMVNYQTSIAKNWNQPAVTTKIASLESRMTGTVAIGATPATTFPATNASPAANVFVPDSALTTPTRTAFRDGMGPRF